MVRQPTCIEHDPAKATGKTPSARVTLSYAKMTSTYAPQNPDGSRGTAIPTEGSWDLKAAQKI